MNAMLRKTGPLTLWLGMYSITATLFFLEIGSLATGLTMGLLSATLKTIWGLLHQQYVVGYSK